MQANQVAVSALMRQPVVTVPPQARAGDVLALAAAKGVHHFPIVEDRKLIGIICTCDLQDLSPDARVEQVAWRYVVSLAPAGSLADAARLMTIQGVGSIVVVDGDGVCGIVTREDLVGADPELDQLLWEARCSACGARRHLRPGPEGTCICQDCQTRAKDGAWLELGSGG